VASPPPFEATHPKRTIDFAVLNTTITGDAVLLSASSLGTAGKGSRFECCLNDSAYIVRYCIPDLSCNNGSATEDKVIGSGLAVDKIVKSNYFIVRPKVDQRAGLLSLPHL